MISASERPKYAVPVNPRRKARVEMGRGDPIIFQHGNPTSSYRWRNFIPALAAFIEIAVTIREWNGSARNPEIFGS